MPKRKRRTKKTETIGNGFVMVDIQNPMFSSDHAESTGNPRRIKALQNVRESPITWMYAHKEQTGITEAHVAAAGKFRRLYEAAGGAGVGSFDYTREPVDGGGVTDPLNDRMVDAAKELAGAATRLGPAGYDLVEKVCGQCIFISELNPRRRMQDKISSHLKDCLDSLAAFWGLRTPKMRSYSAAGRRYR